LLCDARTTLPHHPPYSRPLEPLLSLFSLIAIVLSSAVLRAETKLETDRARAGNEARFAGELGQQVAQLKARWASLGQVSVWSPILLDRLATYALHLPASALDPSSPTCTTVALLSSANVSFVAHFSQEDLPAQRHAWPVPSAAGLAELTRCGADKARLRSLQVQMRSRRGVVEIVVLQSKQPPGPLATVLRGRDPGPTAPSPYVGPRPYLAPLSVRIEQYRSLLVDAQTEWSEHAVLSDATGRGAQVFNLNEGCHEFLVLAPQDKNAPPDVDARLSDLVRGDIYQNDDQQAGDAHLLHCAGQTERVVVDFNGANPETELVIIHLSTPLPEGLPVSWGSRARSLFAQGLRAAGTPPLQAPPLVSGLGVRGKTTLPLELSPHTCYVAAVAPMRGDNRRLVLRVETPLVERQIQTQGPNAAGPVLFCTSHETTGALSIHSVGTAVTWIAALWQFAPLKRGPQP